MSELHIPIKVKSADVEVGRGLAVACTCGESGPIAADKSAAWAAYEAHHPYSEPDGCARCGRVLHLPVGWPPWRRYHLQLVDGTLTYLCTEDETVCWMRAVLRDRQVAEQATSQFYRTVDSFDLDLLAQTIEGIGDRGPHDIVAHIAAAERLAPRTWTDVESSDDSGKAALLALAAGWSALAYQSEWEKLYAIVAARLAGVSWAALAQVLGHTSAEQAREAFLAESDYDSYDWPWPPGSETDQRVRAADPESEI